MSLIRVITGSESLRTGNSRLSLQAFIEEQGQRQLKAIWIAEAAKLRRGGISQPSRSNVLAATVQGMTPESGMWHDNTFDVPEGTFFRVYGQQTIKSICYGVRDETKRAVMFLKSRAEGALRRFTFRTLSDPHSSNVVVMIEGRFDIVSIRQAGQNRVPVLQDDIRYSTAEKVRDLIIHDELQAASASPVRVTQKKARIGGKDVVVATSRRGRAINLGD